MSQSESAPGKRGAIKVKQASEAMIPSGYACGAPFYRQRGWRGVLPLPPGKKWPPPKGYTGEDGAWPTYQQVDAWAEQYPGGNLALRLPPGVLGIDIDAYNGKPGARTLAELEATLGPLPPTFRSTARPDDHVSGIRWYRVPIGRHWKEPGDSVELLHSGHRYAVVWPSIHPEGGQYQWLDPLGSLAGVPGLQVLTELDTRWVERLAPPPPAAVQRPNGKPRTPSPGQQYGIAALVGELQQLRATPEGARNNQLNKSAFALAQLVEMGELAGKTVAEELERAGIEIGLEPPRVRATIKSGMVSGLQNPRRPR